MTLKRVLGPVDAGWLVAGNMIGAGIFLTPGLVAAQLPGAAWQLVAWMLGGVLALSGAAIYSELGSRLPKAGGDYQYLTAAFGPGWGFLTAWGAFLFSFSAAAAAMALVAVEHIQATLPAAFAADGVTRLGGAVLILVLTAANVAGARVSGRTTATLTAVPLVGLALLFGYGIATGGESVRWPREPFAAPSSAWPVALGAAMVPVFFTYSGWNAAAYVAGEVRDPGRNLPRGLLLGTGLVMLLYLVVTSVLIASVPQAALAGSTTAGAEAARRLLSPAAERALSIFVALAVLGSANVTLMTGARIYYAVGVDRLAPRFLARTNRAGVPGAALWAGGIWSALLASTGTVSRLVSWATLAILLLSSATVASLFVLRRRDPTGTPYRCFGYPLTPVLYLVATLGVAGGVLGDEIRLALESRASLIEMLRQVPSLIGVLLLAVGLPLYLIARKFGGSR